MPADSSASNLKRAPRGGVSGAAPSPAAPIAAPEFAGLRLRNPFFLAPAAGYSDAAFRSVCQELGAALCYTEMVSAEALARGHPKTQFLLLRHEAEPFYGIQLFGARPETLARAAAKAASHKPLVIDLNCGCPVPKIIRAGAGSALLRNPKLLRDIVAAMRGATDIPITVKIRKGWDEASVNFLETAEAAVEGGAAAVCLHARTRAQGYGGKADWAAIAALAAAMGPRGIPVFGSGDIFSAQAALDMLRATGSAAAMIARGSMGNPFIFAEALALWQGRDLPVFTNAERAAVARNHLARSICFLGEKTACLEFRKQFCAYSKGSSGGAALREKAVRCSTAAEFEEVFKEFEQL